MQECFFTSESKRAKFFFQQAPVILGVYGDVMITVITFLVQKCIILGGGKFGKNFFFDLSDSQAFTARMLHLMLLSAS
jgi:hypothetical protein